MVSRYIEKYSCIINICILFFSSSFLPLVTFFTLIFGWDRQFCRGNLRKFIIWLFVHSSIFFFLVRLISLCCKVRTLNTNAFFVVIFFLLSSFKYGNIIYLTQQGLTWHSVGMKRRKKKHIFIIFVSWFNDLI